jgi:hypothetical protein
MNVRIDECLEAGGNIGIDLSRNRSHPGLAEWRIVA